MLLLACTTMAQAQRWDWVKGYGSSMDYGNKIIGTVTDNDGNLYFLGEFQYGALWNGEPLLPSEAYSAGEVGVKVIIAKISPQGDMVWKKILSGRRGCAAYDIKKVGDTAFACMVDFEGPYEQENLYWLDTLLVGYGDYPQPRDIPSMPMTRLYGRTTAYLKFGFDGTLQEQHFIHLTCVDTNGNNIGKVVQNIFYFENNRITDPRFDIDSEGNIYLLRLPTDQALDDTVLLTVWNGQIQTVQVWVDNRMVGTIDTRSRPWMGYPHLMKFSPHFDTLLDNRHVVQTCTNINNTSFKRPKIALRLDNDANIYMTMIFQTSFDSLNYTQTMVFDSLQEIAAEILPYDTHKGFLVVYDSLLNTKNMIHLYKESHNGIMTLITDVSFDYDSNLVFVPGSCDYQFRCEYDREDAVTLKSRNMDTTVYLYNDCFILKFDRDTWEYKGLMKPSVCKCEQGGDYANIVTKNNRAFMQIAHLGKISLPIGTFQGPNDLFETSTLVIFDYAGNVIGGDNSRHFGADRENGPLALVDSVLYVVQTTASPATFGDYTVHPNGNWYNFVAKYVDTSFMSVQPYTPPAPPTPPEAVQTTVESGTLTLYPNPASSTVILQASDSWQGAVTIVDISGRELGRYPLEAGSRQQTIDVSGLAKGVYFVSITGEQATVVRKLVVQ